MDHDVDRVPSLVVYRTSTHTSGHLLLRLSTPSFYPSSSFNFLIICANTDAIGADEEYLSDAEDTGAGAGAGYGDGFQTDEDKTGGYVTDEDDAAFPGAAGQAPTKLPSQTMDLAFAGASLYR